MARGTDVSFRSKLMYCVFLRQFSEDGDFVDLEEQLDRLEELGVDIIWLMPIHPIGEERRKGTLGSPYANRDYRAINPEYGSLVDFLRLIENIHDRGMKCILDVVYNHTSPDSLMVNAHPEWFYHDDSGKPAPRVAEWSDVIDLDYSSDALREYLIATLCDWAKYVDGFRCDVAPMIPLDFWIEARKAVEEVRPGCMWLAESGEPVFIKMLRKDGVPVLSDGELYQAFDMCYDYDLYDDFVDVVTGRKPLSEYLDGLNRQEVIYPENYIKLRFLENHDRARAVQLIPDERLRRNWLAFSFFQKGTPLIYNGQEMSAKHTPSLFEKDTIDWNDGEDISEFIAALAKMKKDAAFVKGAFEATQIRPGMVLATYTMESRRIYGVFSLANEYGSIAMDLPDGEYVNLIDDEDVCISHGILETNGEPIVIKG